MPPYISPKTRKEIIQYCLQYIHKKRYDHIKFLTRASNKFDLTSTDIVNVLCDFVIEQTNKP